MGGTHQVALVTALGFALAFIQGSHPVAAQNISVVNCTAVNTTVLTNTVNGNFTASILANFTGEEFACLNATTLSLIPANLLSQLYTSKFFLNASVSASVTLKLTNLTVLGSVLDGINKTTAVPADVTTAMMSAIWQTLNPSVANLSDADLTQWFQTRLGLFLPAITATQVADISVSMSCSHFLVISQSLSGVYDNLTDSTRQAVLTKINGFISADVNSTMSKNCTQNITSSTLLGTYFGRFAALANYSDFEVVPAFKGADVLNMLTPVQLADYAVKPNVTNNAALLSPIFPNIIGITNMAAFADRLKAANPAFSGSPQAAVMAGVWTQLGPSLANLSDAEVSNWFQQRLSPFILPGITSDMVANISTGLNCTAFASISQSLSGVYDNLNDSTKQAVLSKIKSFITADVNSAMSKNCTQNINSSMLLGTYFGRFAALANYSDFEVFPAFNGADVLNRLTAVQLADYAVKPNVMSNATLLAPIFPNINSLSDMTAFVDRLKVANPAFSGSPQAAVMAGVWTQLGPSLANLSDAEVSNWFQQRLSPFILPGITSDMVANISTGLNCTAFASIAGSLNNASLSNDTKVASYKWIIKYLSVNGTSLRCFPAGNSTTTTTQWLSSTLFDFRSYLVLADFLSIVQKNASIVPASELVTLLNSRSFSNDSISMAQLFDSYSPIESLLDAYNQNGSATFNLLDDGVKSAVVTSVFGRFGKALKLDSTNSTSTLWFSKYLPIFLPSVTNETLALVNLTNCQVYAPAVPTFNNLYANLSSEKRRAVEIWLVRNLNSADATRPPCYAGANSWLADNLQQYFLLTTQSELEMLVINTTQLAGFITDPSTLSLLKNANNLDSNMMLYLVKKMKEGNISVNNVPPPLLCTYLVKYSTSITPDNLSALMMNISACDAGLPTGRDKDKLSAVIVASVGNFTSDVIRSMGSVVVAIPAATIDSNLTAGVVRDTLSTLAIQQGWSLGQARKLVQKLSGTLPVNNATDLQNLGTLVSGVSSATFMKMDITQLDKYMTNPNMTKNIETLPPGVQSLIVTRLLKNNGSSASYISQLAPSAVVQIPPENLRNTYNNINSVPNRPWTVAQALVLTGLIPSQSNIGDIMSQNPSLLPGFKCTQLGLTTDAMAFLGKLSSITYQLTASQEGCLAENVTNADASLPSNVLLMVPKKNVFISCPAITKMGKGDINRLPKDQTRTNLLTKALTCVRPNLSAGDVAVLGNLSCELSGVQILNADVSVLDNLKQCRVYSADQASSIQRQLVVRYGNSSNWTSQNLKDMGDMVTTLDNNTLNAIQSTELGALVDYVSNLAQARNTQPALLTFTPNVMNINARFTPKSQSRRRRDTCTIGQLTSAKIIEMGQTLALLSPTDLGNCMSLTVFNQSIENLGKVNFTTAQLATLKGMLNSIFPATPPPDVLLTLGTLALAFTPAEIATFNLTSIDTVAKLAETPGWSTDQIKAVAANYELQTLIGQMTASELKSLGVFVSGLSDVSLIDNTQYKDAAESIGNVTAFNSSQLAQLWTKANQVFPSPYASGVISQLGSVVAGASAAQINGLNPSQIAEIKPLVIPLIPVSVFKDLNVTTVQSLQRNAAFSISNDQYYSLSVDAKNALSTMYPSLIVFTPPKSPGLGYNNVPYNPTGGAAVPCATAFTLVAALLLPSLGLLLA